MKTHKYAVKFNNEAPKIGSGLRVVEVKEGRVWAYITSPALKKIGVRCRQRMKVKEWRRIKKYATSLPQ